MHDSYTYYIYLYVSDYSWEVKKTDAFGDKTPFLVIAWLFIC